MTWLTIAVSVATPILALAGAMAGQLVTRRTAAELDIWRRREETMRLMRWGAELAVSDRAQELDLGVVVLESLLDAEMLQVEDRSILNRVLDAVTQPRVGNSAGPGNYAEHRRRRWLLWHRE